MGADRLLAQLQTLHALSARLNALQDVAAIGEAVKSELNSLIDYHSCRVYRLQPDGVTLYPVAFGWDPTVYQADTVEDLITKVGEGLTGHVAETRESYYAPSALNDPFAVDIPGTDDVEESMLGVPFIYGDQLVGVLILSMLGANKFDEDDIRMLEVFAPHVAVAMINAELLQRERDSTRSAEELLRLSQAMTRARDVDEVMREAVTAIPALVPCLGTFVYRRDSGGDFALATIVDTGPWSGEGPPPLIPREVAGQLVRSLNEPFILTREAVAAIAKEFRTLDTNNETMIAPLRWDPDGLGMLAIIAESHDRSFTEREMALVRGIADITSLALGNAGSFEQLEASRDRLRTLDEMKTTFLEAVSHDLRTPLSTVLGIALTLRQGTVDLASDDARDLLERLAANARRLEKLLADLLDLDRLMKGIVEPNRRPIDIAALVTQVVADVEFLGSHEVLLDLEQITVEVDGPKVERIVENLLVNASRHTPSGTPIWVSVLGQDGGVLIAVEDAGPGIPIEDRQSIFEPFRQGPVLNQHSPGTGIGLSLVARFAELHGGRAWVEDREGGGASFRVWLPGAEEAG